MEENKEEDFLTESINSTRNFLFDRVSSPFIFSFIASWLVSNYKIILALFTNTSDSFVFEYKNQLITDYINLTHCLIIPFIVACLYTFGYPYVDRKISKFSLNRKLDIRNDKYSILKTQMRTPDEVEEIRQYHIQREKILKEEIATTRNEADSAQRKLTLLQDNSKVIEAQTKKISQDEALEQRLNKVQKPSEYPKILGKDEMMIISMLGEIKDKFNRTVEEKIVWENGMSVIESKIAIADLIKKGYITRDYNSRSKAYDLELTIDGMKAYKAL